MDVRRFQLVPRIRDEDVSRWRLTQRLKPVAVDMIEDHESRRETAIGGLDAGGEPANPLRGQVDAQDRCSSGEAGHDVGGTRSVATANRCRVSQPDIKALTRLSSRYQQTEGLSSLWAIIGHDPYTPWRIGAGADSRTEQVDRARDEKGSVGVHALD